MRKLFLLDISYIIFIFIFVSTLAQARESTVNSIVATDARINVMGRSIKNMDGSVSFAFPGVSFFINFEGKTLSVDALSSGGQNFIEVSVDDSEPKIFKLAAQQEHIVLVKNTSIQKHRVEIIHRSETWHGSVTFKKFSTEGKFTNASPLSERKILVLGDSVTCGEAIDRIDGGKKDTRWWNPRLSYAMLTAKALDARVHLVCMGGRGLIRSWNGKTDEHNLPNFYEFAIATDKNPIAWDHTQYNPDLIIGAIGTNDFSSGIPERETYVNAYVKLLLQLLNNHPHAKIILTEGSILDGDKKLALTNYLHEAAKRVDDSHVRDKHGEVKPREYKHRENKRVYTVKSTHYPGDKTDAHPTKEQHALMANDLTPQVKAIMNW